MPHSALYVGTPRLLDDLALGRADGRYARLLGQLARVSLLVLDDFLLTPATVEACQKLLEVVEDRAQRRSTLVASQLPVDKWHAAMADPTPRRSRARARPAGRPPHHPQGPVVAQAPAPRPTRDRAHKRTAPTAGSSPTSSRSSSTRTKVRTGYDHAGTVARCTGCDERLDVPSAPAVLARHARRHDGHLGFPIGAGPGDRATLLASVDRQEVTTEHTTN